MDRSRWMKLIKMVDDQDRCEWVNVSFGTGSPGQFRTKGRKTVVVVVVVIVITMNGNDLVRVEENGSTNFTPVDPSEACMAASYLVYKRTA